MLAESLLVGLKTPGSMKPSGDPPAAATAQLCGAFLMLGNGVLQTCTNALVKYLLTKGWPAYRMLSFAMVGSGALFALSAALLQMPKPPKSLWKWIFLRGFFAAANLALTTIAVTLGAPMGEVASLRSVNTVVAAVLGYVFLNETVTLTHMLGIFSCTLGAAVVGCTGLNSLSSEAILGLVLAVMAGFAVACQLICARKSAGIPAAMLACSACIQVGAMLVLMLICGLVSDSTPFPGLLLKWEELGLVLGLIALISTSSLAISKGATLCPAALSATVNTGSCMVVGYILQVCFFDGSVNFVSLVGSGLMLASLVLMAKIRSAAPNANMVADTQAGVRRPSAPTADVASERRGGSPSSNPQDAADGDVDDAWSLASFASQEFASPGGAIGSEGKPLPAKRSAPTRLGADNEI
eukprot:TRINITY_DN10690_c0_g1_i1.p1 TRINITY_DN10690_c0_g1~~TRINITY_DN10690_c0_g1_i1.p1  ORF type:complete len:411 (-),score=58.41 TRINITY_DN10690_c0_g1_i1:263-1495(-)